MSLEIALGTLKASISRSTDENDLQVLSGQDCNVSFGNNVHQDGFSAEPNNGNGNCDHPEEAAVEKVSSWGLVFDPYSLLTPSFGFVVRPTSFSPSHTLVHRGYPDS